MHYDIIIIGSGMVGASLACALANSPLRIALIDAQPAAVTDDPRLIALNYSSYCLLQNLKLWPAVTEHAAAIDEVHVSDRGHFGKTRLKNSDLGLASLGYVVPAKYLNQALHAALDEASNVAIFRPATLTNLFLNDTCTTLTLNTATGQQELQATQVIGADGSHSTVRQLLNIPTETVDYQQSALVTITCLQRSHQHIAHERFHATGAIAMLPLTGNRCATIWTDATATIQHLLKLSDAALLHQLQTHFGYRLGRLVSIGKRHTYPLQNIKAAASAKDRVLLIGNAAHTLHPIAAQGLNLALAEIAMLAQILLENVNQPHLQDFLHWQDQLQTTSSRLSHALPEIFSADFLPVQWLRQLGMLGLDICPPAQKALWAKSLGANWSITNTFTRQFLAAQSIEHLQNAAFSFEMDAYFFKEASHDHVSKHNRRN